MNMTNTVTMTTVEIAELTGKAHNNVLRDARKIIGMVNALKSELVESKNGGGHLFKITHKGLNEWLKDKAESMNNAVNKAQDKTDRWGRIAK